MIDQRNAIFGIPKFGNGVLFGKIWDSVLISVVGKGAYAQLLGAKVKRSLTNLASSFESSFPNPSGELNNVFEQNSDIALWMLNLRTGVVHKVFRGYIDRVDKKKSGLLSTIDIRGLDYTSRLLQRNAFDVYTNREVSDIIKNPSDGLMRYFPEITTVGVNVTTKTISEIRFLERNVFDSIKDLGTQVGYDFWVDLSKDLNFVERGFVSSGMSFKTSLGNILQNNFDFDGKKLYNVVKVMGGYNEVPLFFDNKVGDGTTTSYTLGYKPKSSTMYVTVGGAIRTEGVHYIVDYNQHTITFATPPGAGVIVVVRYTANQQVVLIKTNDDSLAKYGERELVITDENIKTIERAEEVGDLNLALYADIRTVGKITTTSTPDLRVGTTVVLDIPLYGINDITYTVVEINHTMERSSGYKTEMVLANSEIASIPEILKQIQADLDEVRKRGMNRDSAAIQLIGNKDTSVGSATQTIQSGELDTVHLIWGLTKWSERKWGGKGTSYSTTYELETAA